jgi:uncharacterized membrane protein
MDTWVDWSKVHPTTAEVRDRANDEDADRPLAQRLVALHRFLLGHAFYPLTLCTLLAFAFLAARIYMMHERGYVFLVKNLFLAWVPYFFSLAADALRRRSKPGARLRIAGVWCAWLAMFPNAPYIFTDLIHWRHRAEMPWWFDLGLVLSFALAGCFVGIVSLRIMHDLVRQSFGAVTGWLFVIVVTILSGFGIDLGRFERWNSWNLLTHPHAIFTQIANGLANPFAHGRTLGVTLMFGTMVLVTYVMFVSTSARPSTEQR